jgi:uncharacterized protein YqfB (UPF0267 family)
MLVMLQNSIAQKKILLNTLMARDKIQVFEIDSSYTLNEFDVMESDTVRFQNRSDVQAIERTMELNQLKIITEKSKFARVWYEIRSCLPLESSTTI